MTRQEMFDRAVTGILKQGRFSADSHGSCYYRFDPEAPPPELSQYDPSINYAAAPVRCAVGHLIPDDEYDIRMEGKLAWSTQIAEAIGGPADDGDLNFLCALQAIHDNCARDDKTMDDFKVGAREFALEHNLSIEVLDQ
jgi:hypothetical protein